MSKPKVITLCGSTRFRDAYEQAVRALTLEGIIVISVGMFGHQEGMDMEGPIKQRLDALHLRKIDISDGIYVLNVGKYVGKSTAREIEYALAHGKTVEYLE